MTRCQFATLTRRITAAALTALAIALPHKGASATGFLYDCTMEDVEAGLGWVSPKIAIVLPGDGTATIIDALTMTFAEDAVPGTILRDNASRLIVKWTLRNVRADSGRSFANFDYRASISKASGRMELTAGPRTFDSGLRSTGTCAERTE